MKHELYYICPDCQWSVDDRYFETLPHCEQCEAHDGSLVLMKEKSLRCEDCLKLDCTCDSYQEGKD